MPKLILPTIPRFLKEATLFTLCAMTGIALSRWGTDTLSQVLQACFAVLFLTPCGWIILYEAALQPVCTLVKSKGRG